MTSQKLNWRASACIAAASLAFALLSSCSSDIAAPDANVRQVVLTPATATAFTNKTVQFTAQGMDAGNAAVPGLVFTWTTGDATIATISTNGLLQPTGKRGTTTVSAKTQSGITGTAQVTLNPPPATIVVVGGAQQTGVVAQVLPQPIVVEVKDADGQPVQGATVTFTAASGASVSAPTATTDGIGHASVSATLGTVAGTQTFSAATEGLSASTTATAKADVAVSLAMVSGDAQTDTVHKTLAAPLVVKVADKFNNGVSGVTVAWSRTGSGSLSAASSTTSADGLANISYTLGGNAASESVNATAPGINGTINFTMRAIASIPDAILITSGGGQAASVNTNFAAPLVARVSDARGFGVAGVVVTWSGVNATPTSATSTTDDAGNASMTVRAGATVGAASVTAAAAGRSSTVSLIAAAGTPTALAIRSQPSNIVAGSAISPPIQIVLVDANGNQTTSSASVTLTLDPSTGTPGAILGGTVTRNAVGGVVAFDNITVDRAGIGYRLIASSGTLTGATTSAFSASEPPVTMTLVSVTQTTCNPSCGTAPANLANAADQLNVTFNVDGAIAGSAAILKCGADSIISIQGSFPDRIPANGPRASAVRRTSAASAVTTVTHSLNSAAFNSTTGAVSLRNGGCTLRGAVKPASSAAAAITSNASAAVTINNRDVVIGRVTIPRQSPNAGGFFSGDVGITAVPVIYSNRAAVSATLGLGLNASGATSSALPAAATVSSAPFTVTFSSAPGGPRSIAGITAKDVKFTSSVVLNTGETLADFSSLSVTSTSPATTFSSIQWNIDNQAPAPGVFPLARNPMQIPYAPFGWAGQNFVFAATAAAGYCGPNSTSFTPANAGTANLVCALDGSQTSNLDKRGTVAGVGGVSVRFQAATSLTGTWFDVSTTPPIGETNTSFSLTLRQITTDALGNADTSFANATAFSTSAVVSNGATRFGVDLTSPTNIVSGPAAQGVFLVNSNGDVANPAAGSSGNYISTILDNLSGTGVAYVAQVRLSTLTTGSFNAVAIEGKTYTNFALPGALPVSQSTTDLSPCSIGRFNQSLASAGTPNLPVYSHTGAVVGYCTAVAYTPGGNMTIPAAAAPSSTGGYYTTLIQIADVAENRATAFTRTVLEDATNPAVLNIDLPGTATGGATVALAASVSDNLDLVRSFAQVTYPAMTLQYPAVAGPGVAFDNSLSRSAAIVPSTFSPFIQNLQLSNGSSAIPGSTTAAGLPTAFVVGAVDAAARSGSLSVAANFVTIPVTGANAFSAAFTNGFSLAANTANVSNCVGCAANPSTVTFTATATGTTSVFNNPFTTVQFWYQPTVGGPWHLAGTASGSTASDNGVTRTWNYAFTWDPPATAPTQTGGVTPNLTPSSGTPIAVPVRAIGITSAGDAVASSVVTINLTNP